MQGIHNKSYIRVTEKLIRSFHDAGEGLCWERYERQLPFCGFTSNGLNCRKCLRGPCRINPFGDEPIKGLCGADGAQIVMENIFQISMEGVLEGARALGVIDRGEPSREFPDFGADLPVELLSRIKRLGFWPVKKSHLWDVKNSYFSDKDCLSDTVTDLLRLGLINYGIMKQTEDSIQRTSQRISKGDSRSGSTPFDPDGINIVLAGVFPAEFIIDLMHSAAAVSDNSAANGINILAQESVYGPLAHIPDNFGSSELLLAMNVNALVLSRLTHEPGLKELAMKQGIPVIVFADNSEKPVTGKDASSRTIDKAVWHKRNASYLTGFKIKTVDELRETGKETDVRHPFFQRWAKIKTDITNGDIKGVAVIAGEANAKQAFFERTLSTIEALLPHRILVLLAGEIGSAVRLIKEELLHKIREKRSSLTEDSLDSVHSLGSMTKLPDLITLFNEFITDRSGEENTNESFASLPVVFIYPEFYKASTWTSVLSLLSLGFTVQIGTSLPFWGSPELTGLIGNEWSKAAGGVLLTAPQLPDAQSQAEEAVSILQQRDFLV